MHALFPHKVRTCFHFSEKEKACRCTSVCIQQTSACVVPASALSSSLYRPYSSVKAMSGLLATNAAACGHSFLFLKAKKLYHVTQIWEAPWGDVIIGKCRISSYSAMELWAHGRRPVCPVTHIFILMMTPQKTAIFATMSTPIPKQSSIIFLVLSDLWNLSSEWGKPAGLCGCADLACRSKGRQCPL